MRAVVVEEYGGPEVLGVSTVDDPEPTHGEVRVSLKAAGVNPADCYIRNGTYAFFRPDLPYTPGFDAAGVVESVGPGVNNWQTGARVYVSSLLERRRQGTYAELFVCSTESVRTLPPKLTPAQGAAIGVPCGAAWRALHQRALLQPGEVVLVHGASGAVGLPSVQLANAHGARVIGTAGSAKGAEVVAQAGAAHVLRHDKDNYLDAVADLTDGHGADVILEMLADENLMADLQQLAMYGRIVVVGSRGELPFTPRATMTKEASVLGMALWNATPLEWAAMNDGVEDAITAEVITLEVEQEYELEEAAEAQRAVIQHRAEGKIVLRA